MCTLAEFRLYAPSCSQRARSYWILAHREPGCNQLTWRQAHQQPTQPRACQQPNCVEHADNSSMDCAARHDSSTPWPPAPRREKPVANPGPQCRVGARGLGSRHARLSSQGAHKGRRGRRQKPLANPGLGCRAGARGLGGRRACLGSQGAHEGGRRRRQEPSANPGLGCRAGARGLGGRRARLGSQGSHKGGRRRCSCQLRRQHTHSLGSIRGRAAACQAGRRE